MLTDSHLHLQRAQDPIGYICAAVAEGITRFALQCVSLNDANELLFLKKELGEQICVFIGCHPQLAWDFDICRFEELLRSPCITGIGECGLDKRPQILAQSSWESQCTVLQLQLAAAYDLDMPVSLHCVKAHNDMLNTLRIFCPRSGARAQLRFCLHGVSCSDELFRQYYDLGAYFGVGPAILRSDGVLLARLKKFYPFIKHRLLLESDADSRAPDPKIYSRLLNALARALYIPAGELSAQFAANWKEFVPDDLPLISSAF